MKKKCLMLILAAVFALGLTACGNGGGNTTDPTDTPPTASAAAAPSQDANALIGSWEYENGNYTYTFNEDGTGTYELYSGTMEFTYEVNGDEVSILYTDSTSPLTLTFSVDGDTLNMIDSFGEDTIYIRK